MARGHPRHAGVEGVEQGLFAFAHRLIETHIERRAHDKALELGLHHAVRAAGAGEPQFIAAMRAHVWPLCAVPRSIPVNECIPAGYDEWRADGAVRRADTRAHADRRRVSSVQSGSVGPALTQ